MAGTNPLTIDPKTTALVLIDLQMGIAGRPVVPHDSKTVISNAVSLAERFRSLGSTVVLVRVSFSADGRDRVNRPVDVAFPGGTPPAGWDEIVPELGPQDSDLIVTKRNWGAFYGTDLDLRLRRRGIETIVLGGIATCFGVESTARDAFEHNYGLVLAEDAMSNMDADAHHSSIQEIFPRLGLVRSTAEIQKALA
jgi:nicotinamidase-related amidase